MVLSSTSPPSLRLRHLWPVADQVEYARRQGLTAHSHASANLADLSPAGFIARTQIKTPQGEGFAAVPFDLWPAQCEVLDRMQESERLVILKARQLGISWLACGYVLWLCTRHPGKTVLLFSQGQLEANELIERISFMYYQHKNRTLLPPYTTENTGELEWANGSNVKSLPATKKAGRSFSASLVVFDEFAFMLYGAALYAAAKPTIDDGGKLWIISSADGLGSPYHIFWEGAKSGANGFIPIFLPWQARPSRDPQWRARKLTEAFVDSSEVLREYPANDIEAFTHAAGLIYDVWSDGPPDGSVTEAADYIPSGGEVLWAVDDGYEGRLDPATGFYTEKSAPRVFLLVQVRADGHICVFAEHYAVKMLQEEHIARVMVLPHDLDEFEKPDDDRSWSSWANELRGRLDCFPEPEYAVVDSAAAELRGRLRDADVPTFGKPGDVEESIKTTRRMVAPDANGVRRVWVHPRCKHLRAEFASYRRGENGKPIDAFNHGLDALRYLCWHLRYE